MDLLSLVRRKLPVVLALALVILTSPSADARARKTSSPRTPAASAPCLREEGLRILERQSDPVRHELPGRRLLRKAEDVLAVDWGQDINEIPGVRDGKMGGLNHGVYRARISEGPVLFKIGFGHREAPEEYASVLAAHQMLADRGYAPRIRGILSEAELRRIYARYRKPFPSSGKFTPIGYLIDEIPGGWATKYPGVHLPPEARKWNPDRIEARMTEIMEFLTRQKIDAGDLQFLISREGVPYVIDTDLFDPFFPWVKDLNRDRLQEHINNLRRALERDIERPAAVKKVRRAWDED